MQGFAKFTPNYNGIFLTCLFFSLYIVVAILSIFQTGTELQVLNGLSTKGENVDFDYMTQVLQHRHWISNFTIVIYLTCRSLFVNWAYYAHKNLQFFHSTGLQFDTWRMIFGFIIPLLNFYLPIVAINEIWQGSDPKIHDVETMRREKTSRFIITWWLLNLFWIAFSIFDNIMKVSENNIARVKVYYQLTTVGDIMGIVVALWTILVIIMVTRKQIIKYRLITGNTTRGA